MTSLIDMIRNHPETARYLDWPGDFDLERTENLEPVHLASGQALECIAGDGAGGRFYLCGDGGDERPVLYADSEGSAGLIARSLPELLQLIIVAPWWHGCEEFTAEESQTLSLEYREDIPDLDDARQRAAEVLGLDLPAEGAALARLREVFVGGQEEFVLIFTPENNRFDPLFHL